MKMIKDELNSKRKNMRLVLVCWLIVFGAAATIFAQVNFTVDDGKNNPGSPAQAFFSLNGGGTFHTVSGNVKANGANLPDATVFLIYNSSLVESATTDANGNYSLNALQGFSYAASVYKDGYNFNPAYQVLINVQSNLTINFQNGTQLCTPAPFGRTGDFCPNAAPTDVSPAENGRIAYEIFGSAFAVDADGTNQAQLPPGGAFPSWSPDGTKVLYNRDPSNDIGFDQEIFLMTADGSTNTQLIGNDWSEYRARFSPDGARIVFERLVNSSDIGVYTMNADGSNQTRLTPVEVIARDASFSPDGTKIVYTDGVEIFVMNADGSLPQQLTSSGEKIYNIEPSWSPDGAHIVFTSNRGGEGNEIWRMTAAGIELVALTGDDFDKRTPVYSPDGTRIAFSRERSLGDYREIYSKPLFGGVAQRLTFTFQSSNAESPSWQRVVGSVNTTLVGGVNLIFSNVTGAGNTVATPIAPASAGVLPPNFQFFSPPIAYDVRTSAQFAGDIEICFDVPNVNDETLFDSLVVFHNEGGELIDRTSSRDFPSRKICATVTSLSPFVVAAPAAPTAASVTVSGRVFTPTGRGLMNATILITDSSGNRRSTRTSMFGDYLFEEVEAGQIYIFEVRSKRFRFRTQVVTVTEELSELDFTASF